MGAWRVILQVLRWPLRAGEEVGRLWHRVCVAGCGDKAVGKARVGEAGRWVQGVQRWWATRF